MRSALSILFLPLSLTFAVGCQVQQPTTGDDDPGEVADMARPHTGNGNQGDMAKPSGPIAPPTLQPVPAMSQYATVPVHGNGIAGTNVMFEGGPGGSVVAEVMANGTFCVDLTIGAVGVVTNFTAKTIDNDGNESSKINLSVTRQAAQSTQPTQPSSTSSNVAVGGNAWASYVSDATNNGLYTTQVPVLVDGNASTAATATAARQWDGLMYSSDTVYVQLKQLTNVNKLVIKSTADCPLTAPAKVFVASANGGGNPYDNPTGWNLVGDYAYNTFPADGVVNIAGGTPVLWIAIALPHGATPSLLPGSDNLNCGGFSTAYAPEYGFAEIEAWSTPNVVAPAPTSNPSCTSGS